MNNTTAILLIFALIIALGIIIYFAFQKPKTKEKPMENNLPDKGISAENLIAIEKFKMLYPLRLQAYERLVLFLERIELSNLVMRNNTGNVKYNQLHATLLNAVLEEYEHNVAQQIYVTENTWNLTKQAKEETINILNIAANELEKDNSGADLSRKIFEKMMLIPKSPSQIALDYIRQELKAIV